MLPKHRILSTLLLLVIVMSQALGAAHASSHVGSDAGECALCATYGKPAAVLPSTGLLPLAFSIHALAVDFLPLAVSPSAVLCIHQRGPPPRI
jgi:hypothetical protein